MCVCVLRGKGGGCGQHGSKDCLGAFTYKVMCFLAVVVMNCGGRALVVVCKYDYIYSINPPSQITNLRTDDKLIDYHDP